MMLQVSNMNERLYIVTHYLKNYVIFNQFSQLNQVCDTKTGTFWRITPERFFKKCICNRETGYAIRVTSAQKDLAVEGKMIYVHCGGLS